MGYRSQLPNVTHNHLVAKFFDLFANPDWVRVVFHGDPSRMNASEPPIHPSGIRAEASSVDHLAVFVQAAVMAPDVPQVDSNRDSDPGPSAWTLWDEELRMLYHAHSVSRFEETFSSHFSVTSFVDQPINPGTYRARTTLQANGGGDCSCGSDKLRYSIAPFAFGRCGLNARNLATGCKPTVSHDEVARAWSPESLSEFSVPLLPNTQLRRNIGGFAHSRNPEPDGKISLPGATS
jgi:hypothetical protein